MAGDILGVMVAIQGEINRSVGADLSAFAQTRDWLNLAAVMPLGVLFGAVHALTPGHSKTILASYVAGSSLSVARGIGVAVVLSFTHILSAVLIAVLALPLVTRSLVGAGRAPLIEDLSRGIIALIGLWMIVRAWGFMSRHHENGAMFGVIAGLIPCPLTLFAMVLAISRGVPEAGLVFAFAMMLGVALTLSVLAALSVLARGRLAWLLARHGTTLSATGRALEAAAGLLLLAFGLREVFLR